MTIKTLSTLPFDTMVDCFVAAFENYFVKMPTDKAYYKKRWKAAKVDFSLSYGMFDQDQLIGFIIHAIDTRAGVRIAYNTGTGVLPAYRGKRIVKSIYEYAFKDLQEKGVEKCTLEVIIENTAAIRAYESVGFKICKTYKSYSGNPTVENPPSFEIKEIPLEKIDWGNLPNQKYYSWDFQKNTILERNYSFYQVLNNGKPESFFIFHPELKYIAQFDLLDSKSKGWNRLFAAMHQVSDTVKIVNVDERLKDKIDHLVLFGLKNSVNQYEMETDYFH